MGGTRIALELDEYRESEDIDFICSDLAGYRALRATVENRSLGILLPRSPAGVSLLRDVRTDQYGIRTVFGVDGEPVKFEIILEARIHVTAANVKRIPVPVLDRISCFAETWLANADRWNDTAVLSRDAFDLAFMLSAWDIDDARAGAELAVRWQDSGHSAFGTWRLPVADSKSLASGLKKFAKVAKDLP